MNLQMLADEQRKSELEKLLMRRMMALQNQAPKPRYAKFPGVLTGTSASVTHKKFRYSFNRA